MPSPYQFDIRPTSHVATTDTINGVARSHNADKVAAMRAAIAEGRLVVNAEAIADQLLARGVLAAVTPFGTRRRR